MVTIAEPLYLLRDAFKACLRWFNQILDAIPLSRPIVTAFVFCAILFSMFILPLRGYGYYDRFGRSSDRASNKYNRTNGTSQKQLPKGRGRKK